MKGNIGNKSSAMSKKFVKEKKKKYWSGYVTKHSNALDLEDKVFTWKDPKRIAKSLKRSAELSMRRKAKPFQSTMSMLNFYINRAGKSLPRKQKKILEQAKVELQKAFNRPRPKNNKIK
jgi:putative cell wall-binding protein